MFAVESGQQGEYRVSGCQRKVRLGLCMKARILGIMIGLMPFCFELEIFICSPFLLLFTCSHISLPLISMLAVYTL